MGGVGRKGESLGKQMVERDKKEKKKKEKNKTWEANAHIGKKLEKKKIRKKKNKKTCRNVYKRENESWTERAVCHVHSVRPGSRGRKRGGYMLYTLERKN